MGLLYFLTKLIELPFLIKSKEDFYCFEKILQQPNWDSKNLHQILGLIKDYPNLVSFAEIKILKTSLINIKLVFYLH